jgi:hypothetical protein
MADVVVCLDCPSPRVQVVLPLALGVGLMLLVVKNGKYLVNKPQLCPHLAVTVQAAPKGKVKKA